MASVYVTGDIHGDPLRLSDEHFPAQKSMRDGQANNFVIICGDFGLVWDQLYESKREKYLLNWLEKRPFTTLWVDGNHENFDRLYSSEYPIEEWHGGKVQKIRPHVIHLLRGEIYNILDHSFFAFGGAASHDIRDGILDPNDEETIKEWSQSYYKVFRVNHVSWWSEELATDAEMQHGSLNLKNNNNAVDFIITHCMPQEICSLMSFGAYYPNRMTLYFNKIMQNTSFKRWISGHYHCNECFNGRFDVLYDKIIRIV